MNNSLLDSRYCACGHIKSVHVDIIENCIICGCFRFSPMKVDSINRVLFNHLFQVTKKSVPPELVEACQLAIDECSYHRDSTLIKIGSFMVKEALELVRIFQLEPFVHSTQMRLHHESTLD